MNGTDPSYGPPGYRPFSAMAIVAFVLALDRLQARPRHTPDDERAWIVGGDARRHQRQRRHAKVVAQPRHTAEVLRLRDADEAQL
jgi:hypothetical protein